MNTVAESLARLQGYVATGNFSFLYPLKIIKTQNSALIGAKTKHPFSFTLAELIQISFEPKTYRFVFPAYAGQPAEDRKLFRAFLDVEHVPSLKYFLHTESFSTLSPNLFEGNGTDYDAYITGKLGLQRKINRTEGVWCGALWGSDTEQLEVRCFDKDGSAVESTCYFYDGLYYPKISYDGIRITGSTVRSSSYQYAHTIATGSVTVFGRALSIYAEVAGFGIPTGITFSVADKFDQQGA